jgi:hypothetical protein
MVKVKKKICKWMASPIDEYELKRIIHDNMNGSSRKVRVELREIPIEKLQIDKSRGNNARIGDDLHRPHVETLKKSMDNGAAIPPIIIKSNGEILSGNHRAASSMELEHTHVMAYVVVNGNPQLHDMIARLMNTNNGLPLKEDERMRQAVQVAQTTSFTDIQVAAKFSVDIKDLQKHVLAADQRDELESHGVDASNFQVGELLGIAKASSDPAVRKVLGKTIVNERFTSQHTAELATKVRKCNGSKQQMQAIKDWRTGVGRTQRKKRPHARRIRELVAGDKGLLEFLEKGNGGKAFTSLDDLELLGDERNELRKHWDKVCKQMKKILSANSPKKPRRRLQDGKAK